MNYVISIIAGFLSGLIGAMGFGGGGILIIYLVIFVNTPQIKAQGMNLIFFIPCAVLSVIIYAVKKEIKFKQIFPIIIGGIVGAIPAGFILSLINTEYLSKVFGIFLLVLGIKSLIMLKKQKENDKINL